MKKHGSMSVSMRPHYTLRKALIHPEGKDLWCCEWHHMQPIVNWKKLVKRAENSTWNWRCQKCTSCIHQGPVVQSIVSLTSSLVVKLLSVLLSRISNSQVVLLKKCEMQKLLTFYQQNNSLYAILNDQSFNDMLTNNIVSFEPMGQGQSESHLKHVLTIVECRSYRLGLPCHWLGGGKSSWQKRIKTSQRSCQDQSVSTHELGPGIIQTEQHLEAFLFTTRNQSSGKECKLSDIMRSGSQSDDGFLMKTVTVSEIYS